MSDRQRFSRGGGNHGPGGPGEGAIDAEPWGEPAPEREPRDWKKAVLMTGLAVLSWVATYVGILELVEANIGDLSLLYKAIIGFSVAMLMIMIVWLLDQMFRPIGFFTRTVYIGGYLFLTLISVGFGFGFYWKVLESRTEGTRGAELAVGQVQAPLQTAALRLDSLQTTLVQLEAMSKEKAEQERMHGTSCPNSRPGDGPRRRLRDEDAGRFAFAAQYVRDRSAHVRRDIGWREGDLIKPAAAAQGLLGRDGTRNDYMRALNRRLDGTVTNFNAFKGDPQLRQLRTELAERADRTTFPDGNGRTFSCPDAQLQAMLRSVVASIDGLPQLDQPKIRTVEGSDATIEAFRRLTTTLNGMLQLKLPPSADELRERQRRAMLGAEQGQSARPITHTIEQAGLSKRDYIPLSIAIFVDFCLLLVALGRSSSRLDGLVPRMRRAERGPVNDILTRFKDIHRDREIRENFEIFRHVVFDYAGEYYAAIPLIAPYSVDRRRPNAYGPKDVEELQQEAHLLANLFTSFEKDKLFTRVVVPILTTSRIQKKLWAQGSKFAHAESFRLYKFKDGAWQDMILGAIMGAAKRIEADKRSRRIERGIFDRHTPEPELQAFNSSHTVPSNDVSTAGMAASAPQLGPLQPIRADRAHGPSGFAPGVPRPSPQPRPVQDGPPVAPPPPRQSYADVPRTRRAPMPTGLESDVVVRPANSNTGPVSETPETMRTAKSIADALKPAVSQRLASSAIMPDAVGPAPEKESLEIAAVERSVTYRLPMNELNFSDLSLPQSIKESLQKKPFSAIEIEAQVEKPAAAIAVAPTEPSVAVIASFEQPRAGSVSVASSTAPMEQQDDPSLTDVDIARITSRFGLQGRNG